MKYDLKQKNTERISGVEETVLHYEQLMRFYINFPQQCTAAY